MEALPEKRTQTGFSVGQRRLWESSAAFFPAGGDDGPGGPRTQNPTDWRRLFHLSLSSKPPSCAPPVSSKSSLLPAIRWSRHYGPTSLSPPPHNLLSHHRRLPLLLLLPRLRRLFINSNLRANRSSLGAGEAPISPLGQIRQ